MAAYCRHVSLMHPFECFIPKHQLTFHLLHMMGALGNPAVYSTWQDEALNRTLKAACKNASQACFEDSILVRMRELLRPSDR